VQQLISSGGAPPAGAAAAQPAPSAGAVPAGGEWTDEAVSQVKRVTAARLLESKQTIPHYYLTMECEVDALLALRAQVNKQLGEAGVKLSVNDFIVKAAALALRKVRPGGAPAAAPADWGARGAPPGDGPGRSEIRGGMFRPSPVGGSSAAPRPITTNPLATLSPPHTYTHARVLRLLLPAGPRC
jgi:hypothetical protein